MTVVEPVYIVAASRTPIGSFNGDFKSFTAVDLGVIATKKALESLPNIQIDEVYFGNVLSAGVGQNPARQVCIKSGLAASIPCTTVNKVCASGMKVN